MAYYKCASIYGTNNSAASVQTASGAIANFSTKLAMPFEGLVTGSYIFEPMKSLEINNINATQEAGTPTPQSPKAISGVSAVNVIHCGKNLLNYNNVDKVVYNAQLQERNGIEITKAGTFTTSSNYSGECTLYTKVRYADGTYGSANTVQNGDVKTPKTSTLTSGQTLIFFDADTTHTIEQTKAIFEACQIELSSNATTYEPYNGSTTLINLGDTYYGCRVSQDKNGKRELVKTKQLYSFSGNESWTWNDQYQYWLMPFSANVGSKICLCEIASNINILYKKLYLLSKYNPTITGESNMNAIFSNGVKLVYDLPELVQPIKIPLPDGTPIKTLPGVNNIYADTGDTKVAYKRLT